jgi:hypothetical protein
MSYSPAPPQAAAVSALAQVFALFEAFNTGKPKPSPADPWRLLVGVRREGIASEYEESALGGACPAAPNLAMPWHRLAALPRGCG